MLDAVFAGLVTVWPFMSGSAETHTLMHSCAVPAILLLCTPYAITLPFTSSSWLCCLHALYCVGGKAISCCLYDSCMHGAMTMLQLIHVTGQSRLLAVLGCAYSCDPSDAVQAKLKQFLALMPADDAEAGERAAAGGYF